MPTLYRLFLNNAYLPQTFKNTLYLLALRLKALELNERLYDKALNALLEFTKFASDAYQQSHNIPNSNPNYVPLDSPNATTVGVDPEDEWERLCEMLVEIMEKLRALGGPGCEDTDVVAGLDDVAMMADLDDIDNQNTQQTPTQSQNSASHEQSDNPPGRFIHLDRDKT